MDIGALPAPLQRPEHTFTGRAVEVLRELVLTGRIRAGERLNEVELSSALRISRGPLREAIRHLCSEGLLVMVSHRGAFVRTFSDRELAELYEVRIALEAHALRVACATLDAPRLADLRILLSDTDQLVGADNSYPRDPDFHQRVVDLASNDMLSAAVVDVHRKIHLARSRSGGQTARAQTALAEHRQIVDLIADGKPEKAVRALTAHLRASLANALDVLHHDSETLPGS